MMMHKKIQKQEPKPTIDLGESRADMKKTMSPDGQGYDKTIYPSLYLTSVKDSEAIKNLGKEGTATIKYAKKSHTETERDGEKTHAFEFEIHSITPESQSKNESEPAMPQSKKASEDEKAIDTGLEAAEKEGSQDNPQEEQAELEIKNKPE
jgi:hypothetical protein